MDNELYRYEVQDVWQIEQTLEDEQHSNKNKNTAVQGIFYSNIPDCWKEEERGNGLTRKNSETQVRQDLQ